MNFSNLLTNSAEYEKIITSANSGLYPMHVTGPSESVKAHFVVSLLKSLDKKGFIITYSELQAKKLLDDIQFFERDNAILIPETALMLHKAEASGNEAENNRMSALTKIKDITVTIA